jgi:hypothetical protein
VKSKQSKNKSENNFHHAFTHKEFEKLLGRAVHGNPTSVCVQGNLRNVSTGYSMGKTNDSMNIGLGPSVVAHMCNPCYQGDGDQEDCG